MNPIYINILKYIYQNATSFIRLHKDSEHFKLEKGVKQGNCISPKLFTACLGQIFQKLNREEIGIKIDGEIFNNLRFVDEIVIASEDPEELQTMLKMNLSMIQVMFNNHIDENDQNILVDGFQLKVVTSYTYLGQLVSTDSSKDKFEDWFRLASF